MEAGVLPTRNGGQRGFHAWEPHRVLLGFTLNLENSLSYFLHVWKLLSSIMSQLKYHLSRGIFLNKAILYHSPSIIFPSFLFGTYYRL